MSLLLIRQPCGSRTRTKTPISWNHIGREEDEVSAGLVLPDHPLITISFYTNRDPLSHLSSFYRTLCLWYSRAYYPTIALLCHHRNYTKTYPSSILFYLTHTSHFRFTYILVEIRSRPDHCYCVIMDDHDNAMANLLLYVLLAYAYYEYPPLPPHYLHCQLTHIL